MLNTTHEAHLEKFLFMFSLFCNTEEECWRPKH